MATTTIGVKLDDGLRNRLKTAAERMGRSSHWLIKQGIHLALERAERGEDLTGMEAGDALHFGVAAACLKHSLPGDFNLVAAADVQAFLGENSLDVKR